MNIDIEEATMVAYDCASRIYKVERETKWGGIELAKMERGVEKCHDMASEMVLFLISEYKNSSYQTRVTALKSVVTLLEGILSLSKNLGSSSSNTEDDNFVALCRTEKNATAICERAREMTQKIQSLQSDILNSVAVSKKNKM